MNLVHEDKYLIIYKETIPNRKTPIYYIKNTAIHDCIELGVIKWYQSWRKFCFYPNGDTVWDNKCLAALYTFLIQLNDNYKKKDVE